MREKSLFSGKPERYSFSAAAKSAAGRRNPSKTKATQHAPSVFFSVVASAHPFFAQWNSCHWCCQIMVARAGQPSGWPVSFVAGIPTPVRATTPERRNSSGSYQLTKEIAIMATALISSRPEFTFIFAAIRRADSASRPCMLRTVADDEHAARRVFARDYILAFAGRLSHQVVVA